MLSPHPIGGTRGSLPAQPPLNARHTINRTPPKTGVHFNDEHESQSAVPRLRFMYDITHVSDILGEADESGSDAKDYLRAQLYQSFNEGIRELTDAKWAGQRSHLVSAQALRMLFQGKTYQPSELVLRFQGLLDKQHGQGTFNLTEENLKQFATKIKHLKSTLIHDDSDQHSEHDDLDDQLQDTLKEWRSTPEIHGIAADTQRMYWSPLDDALFQLTFFDKNNSNSPEVKFLEDLTFHATSEKPVSFRGKLREIARFMEGLASAAKDFPQFKSLFQDFVKELDRLFGKDILRFVSTKRFQSYVSTMKDLLDETDSTLSAALSDNPALTYEDHFKFTLNDFPRDKRRLDELTYLGRIVSAGRALGFGSPNETPDKLHQQLNAQFWAEWSSPAFSMNLGALQRMESVYASLLPELVQKRPEELASKLPSVITGHLITASNLDFEASPHLRLMYNSLLMDVGTEISISQRQGIGVALSGMDIPPTLQVYVQRKAPEAKHLLDFCHALGLLTFIKAPQLSKGDRHVSDLPLLLRRADRVSRRPTQ